MHVLSSVTMTNKTYCSEVIVLQAVVVLWPGAARAADLASKRPRTCSLQTFIVPSCSLASICMFLLSSEGVTVY
jgi:hypothetical protein